MVLSYCTSPTRPPSGSDVVYADVMGSHIIILNSIKAGHELLDKRSTIYSDRYDTRGCSEAPLAIHSFNAPHRPLFAALRKLYVKPASLFSLSDPMCKTRNGIHHWHGTIWLYLAASAPSIPPQLSPRSTGGVTSTRAASCPRPALQSSGHPG